VHPDDAAATDRELDQAIASGGRHPYDVRYRVRCEDGLYRWVRARGKVVTSPDGRAQRMLGVAFDIDERVKTEQKLGELLRYDPVTGLPKQSKFLSDLDGVLNQAGQDRWVAVVQFRLVDLDRLIEDAETTEDSRLVRMIGDRLHDLSGVLVARVASDVFALATPPMPSAAAAQRDAQNTVANLLEPVRTQADSMSLRVHAGGVLGRQGGEPAIALLRRSGHALSLARRTAEVAVRWFNEELSVEFSERNDRIRGLDSAVRHGEIECRYQPLVDLRTGRTAGFEALARWRRKDGRLALPDQFIALAEEIGKIDEIGEEVLRLACEAAVSWPAPHPFVAVNVSPLQLEDPAFPATVARVLKTTGLSPARLELEITENALPRDQAVAVQRLCALRTLGVLIAIDDFGTGYSSLTLLSQAPFTRLKIDRSFISGNGNARETMIIVDTIIDLAKNLELSTTAEGVETAPQSAMLAAKGINLAQGYYFSQPVEASQAANLVTHGWDLPSLPSGAHPGLRLVQ
jgi:predicted signal transduction protein with EAL and GGDEF domain